MRPTYRYLLSWIPWSRAEGLLRFALRRLREEQLPQVAASLTFTTVLGVVPLLTIALAIFTAFPLFDTFRTALEAYFIQNLMPRGIADTILEYLNQFAAKSLRLSALGGAILVVTAVAMMLTIDRVFNRIWRVKARRPLTQRVLTYWTILTLGPSLIGLSIKITAYLFTATPEVRRYVPLLGGAMSTLLSVLLTSLAFALVYLTVPNRRVNWRDAAWGGFVAAIAFEGAKRLFALYVTGLPTYTMVYGTIAALPVFLLWIYTFWMITLGGALVAAALPVVRHERWWHVDTPGSAFVEAMAVLRVLVETFETSRAAAVDGETIRRHTRLGYEESEGLLERMLEVGWVARVGPERPVRQRWRKTGDVAPDRWVLTANPDLLRLSDVFTLFVFNLPTQTALTAHVSAAIQGSLNETLSTFFQRQPEVRMRPALSASPSTSASSR